MSPGIVMDDIEDITRFRKFLEGMNNETNRDCRSVISKYSDLQNGWKDIKRKEFDKNITMMTDFLKIYSRNLEDYIEWLKKIERACQDYMDAGRR